MIPSVFQVVNDYVKKYNEAYNNGNVDQAIHFGKQAVTLAQQELRDPNCMNRNHYESVINGIKPFLENPKALMPKKKASNDTSDDKIKTTDWFAAPIPNLKLSDIAGLKDVKDEFMVNIFAPTDPKYADIYKKYRGDDVGLQILLYGPPGTGKTHAVKCLAGAMGCKIAVVQIKDVMANLVGDGAKIISEIFEQARKYEKTIIFFDEIDAIASSREGEDSRHTKEQLTTLLTNMDGFTSNPAPGQIRIVIAATNRPWALDSAVKRGGRFDTQIYIPLPDAAAREKLIRLALGKDKAGKNKVDIPLAADVTIDWLVERTRGYAGADIKSICRQAIALPLRREIFSRYDGKYQADCVTKNDFEEVFNKYINSITYDSLIEFDAYRMNMEYSKDYVDVKFDMILKNLYSNYMYETTKDARYPYRDIEPFELHLFMTYYAYGYVQDRYSDRADALKFLPDYLQKLCELKGVTYRPAPQPDEN